MEATLESKELIPAPLHSGLVQQADQAVECLVQSEDHLEESDQNLVGSIPNSGEQVAS